MLNIHRRFSVDPRVQDFFCVTHFNKGSILNILESVCLYQCSKKAQNPDSWPDSWPDPWLLTWYHQYLYQTEAEEDELSHYRKREESWTDWTVILINDKSITLFSFYHDSLSSSGSLWSFWFFYFKSLWSINLLWSYLDSHDYLGPSGSPSSLHLPGCLCSPCSPGSLGMLGLLVLMVLSVCLVLLVLLVLCFLPVLYVCLVHYILMVHLVL